MAWNSDPNHPEHGKYDVLRAQRNEHKRRKKQFGLPCPQCKVLRTKKNDYPKILLPGQKCYLDGYVDPRREMTEDEYRGIAPEEQPVWLQNRTNWYD